MLIVFLTAILTLQKTDTFMFTSALSAITAMGMAMSGEMICAAMRRDINGSRKEMSGDVSTPGNVQVAGKKSQSIRVTNMKAKEGDIVLVTHDPKWPKREGKKYKVTGVWEDGDFAIQDFEETPKGVVWVTGGAKYEVISETKAVLETGKEQWF